MFFIFLYFGIAIITSLVAFDCYDRNKKKYNFINNPLNLDYYKILGIDLESPGDIQYLSLREICVAAQNKKKQFAEDCKGSKIVDDAVNILTNKKKRELYDYYHHTNYYMFVCKGLFWPLYLLWLFYNDILHENS